MTLEEGDEGDGRTYPDSDPPVYSLCDYLNICGALSFLSAGFQTSTRQTDNNNTTNISTTTTATPDTTITLPPPTLPPTPRQFGLERLFVALLGNGSVEPTDSNLCNKLCKSN